MKLNMKNIMLCLKNILKLLKHGLFVGGCMVTIGPSGIYQHVDLLVDKYIKWNYKPYSLCVFI